MTADRAESTSSAADAAARAAWLVVVLLMPVALLNYLDRQMLAAMKFSVMADIPSIGTEANWGFMLGQFKWVYAFLSPIGGYLADRFSRRPTICGSLFVWSAVTWWTGHVTTYDELLWTRSLMGISEAFYIPAALALIADYHPGRTRSRAVGMHQMAIYCGVIVGGLRRLRGGSGLGWRWAFARLRPLRHALRPAADAPAARRAGGGPTAPGRRASLRRSRHAELLANGSFVLLVLYFTLPALAGWVVRDWMPAILKQQFGIGQGQAGVSATLYWQVAAIVGRAPRRLRWRIAGCGGTPRGRIYTSAIGMVLLVPAIVRRGRTPGRWPSRWRSSSCSASAGASSTATTCPSSARWCGPELRATGYGLMNLVSISCGGFADWGFGTLRDARVPLGAIFSLFALAAGLSVVLVLLVRPRPEL